MKAEKVAAPEDKPAIADDDRRKQMSDKKREFEEQIQPMVEEKIRLARSKAEQQ